MSAIPSKEVTTQQVKNVRFGFYTDEEVRKFSVKRIVTPVIFDNLRLPIPDGLYDPALGPIDPRGSCTTCGLMASHCPGHFGHIELPLPVYNPLIFNTLYRILRSTCLYCFHFRISRDDVERFITKLQCLEEGNLVDAAGMSLGKHTLSKELEQVVGEDAKSGKPGMEPHASHGRSHKDGARKRPLTSHSLEAIQDTIHEFFTRIPKGKCQNCGAVSPNIKKQGNMKLFKVWTSMKAIVQNQMRGTVIKHVLDDDRAAQEMEATMAAEVAQAKKQRKQQQQQRKQAKQQQAEDKKAELGDVATKDEQDGMGDELMKEVDDDDDVKGEGLKEDVDMKDADGELLELQQAGGISGKGKQASNKNITLASLETKYMNPLEVEETLRRLWQCEWSVLSHIYAADKAMSMGGGEGRKLDASAAKQAYKMFFLRVLPVAPNKFRPPSKVGETMFEHVQNTALQKILTACLELQSVQEGLADAADELRAQELGRYVNIWLNLQNQVAALLDSTMAENTEVQGIRQQLEKKEGLFRKNMMGKRVNFAARSVISPDPYIAAGEIGVPPYFAKRLSFPERVTPWNVERLRELVIRGTEEHPGAVAVEDERGRIVSLAVMSRERREALAKQLLSSTSAASGAAGRAVGRPANVGAAGGQGAAATPIVAGPGKIVYRHLQNGDLMLTNRQPTLHKPGLMAHRARVLKGERTIRMHYANCSTFNADFDGDEINLHLPQDHLGRAEGYHIVHADHQYIVPTDGKPIRGLIQDHVVSGTLLTKRDNFLTRAEYMQLVYAACTTWAASAQQAAHIEMEPPMLVKPRLLWTGKQVVSTAVRFYTRGLPPLTFSAAGKVPADYWGRSSGENELVFHKGYLVSGCVDKAQFGKFGLVHAIQELYGNRTAGQLLSSFSRLFTFYLQCYGFTCGVDDLQLKAPAEAHRKALLARAEAIAIKASAEFVGQAVPDEVVSKPQQHQQRLVALNALVAAALGERYRSNKDTGAAHDMKGSGVMHPLSSEVVGTCLPSGQVKPFPHNCLSLMTVTGAKGSLVNFSQISCLLGQQELEGRRVPRMSSGKTLPCFRPYDAGARSCGFIGDRFLTGLRPQEYYFHCMAGREGLVDTTVKTSRSGYLQRCLIKNLETLRVHYDSTVRDNADNSIVQFYYGEDGIDVMNISYMRQFAFLARNAERFAQQLDLKHALQVSKAAGLRDAEKEVAAAAKERLDIQHRASPSNTDAEERQQAAQQLQQHPPAMDVHPPSVLGSVSEAFNDALLEYINKNPDGLLTTQQGMEEQQEQEQEEGGKKKRRKQKQQEAGFEAEAAVWKPKPAVEARTFQHLMQLKFMRSLAAAGEAVGVLAGQSVGEPSTQMTLNTFHMAGRGEANVTLGIPRLREILMTAAAKIKTPVMTLSLPAGMTDSDAQVLANRMRKLRLAECLAGISVEETPVARMNNRGGDYGRKYSITLQMFNPSQYPHEAKLTFKELVHVFRSQFCPKLHVEVEREMKKKGASGGIGRVDISSLGDDEAPGAQVNAAALEEEEVGGSTRARKKSEKTDEFEDFEENEELQDAKIRFRGGRGEAATYAAPDEEDAEIERNAQRFVSQRNELPEDDVMGDAENAADVDDEPGRQLQPVDPDANPDVPAGLSSNQAAVAEAAAAPLKGSSSSKAKGSSKKAGPSSSSSQPLPGGRDSSMMGDVDEQHHRCHLCVVLPLQSPKLLMLEIVERVAANTMVRSTPGIDKVYVINGDRGEAPKVQTDGINFMGVWENADLMDVNQITTNDVSAMLRTYGVEAARATIMREVQSVFSAYGIGVDPRHLSLIADFMTHQGGYRACNRIGIESSVSPFLKMSFETAAHFLTDATLKGDMDDLRAPSARLCVGRVVELGTGSMGLLQHFN